MLAKKSNKSQTVFLNSLGSSTSNATNILTQYPATKGIATYPKNISCPVCNQISLDCRYQNDGRYNSVGHHCQTNSDAQKGQIVNGYICVKESNGHTALFIASQSSPVQSITPPIKKEKPVSPQVSPQPSMNVEARDYWYRKILAELSLFPVDREKLLARGYTEAQIKSQLFASGTKYYKPRCNPPRDLPGLTTDGKLTISVSRSIVIPNFDLEGRVVALRIEDLNPEIKADGKKTGKYRGVSNKDNSSNIFDEQPIETYFPDGEHKEVFIIEAGGHKLRLASFHLNIPAIGGIGGVLRNCPDQFRAALKAAREKYGNKVVFTYVPDGGDCFNRLVRDKIKKELTNFRDFGLEVDLLWWNQTKKKATPDIDELTQQQFNQVERITLTEFLKIGEEAVKDEERQEALDILVNLADSRKFTPHYKISLKDGEYFDLVSFLAERKIDTRDKLICFKADTGVGKTQFTLSYLKQSKIAFTYFTPTNNLGLDIENESRNKGIAAEHIKNDDVRPNDPELNIIACPEQSFNLVGTVLDKIIIYDEAMQQLRTLSQGGTVFDGELGQHRNRHENMMSACRSLILLDEALSDKACDFYQQRSDKELIKVEIVREIPKTKSFTFLEVIKDSDEGVKKVFGDTSILKSEILKYEKSLIVTDSKTVAKALEFLLNAEGKKAIAIHGDNSHLERIQIAIRDINGFILRELPDVLIFSPTCAQGVSIKIKYFTACFGVFRGVFGAEQQYQMLSRCRDNEIPYFIICPQKSVIPNQPLISIEDEEETITFQASLRTKEEYQELAIASLSRRKWYWESFVRDYREVEIIEKRHCLASLEFYLQQRGHKILTEERDFDNASAVQNKETKELLGIKEDTLVFNSPVIPLEEAQETERKNSNPETKATLKKARLFNNYRDIENQDFYSLEFFTATRKQKDFLQRLRRNYFFNNFEEYRELDTLQKEKAFTREITTTKELLRSDIALIKHLLSSGISDLFDYEFSHRDTRVDNVVKFLQSNRSARVLLLKTQSLPKNIDSRQRMEIIKKLVAYIGYKLEFIGEKRIEKIELRHYKLVKDGLKNLEIDPWDFLYTAIGQKAKSDLASLKAGISPQDEGEVRTSKPQFDSNTPTMIIVGEEAPQEKEISKETVINLLDSPEDLHSYLYDFGNRDYNEFKISCGFTSKQLEKLELGQSYKSTSLIDMF